MQAHQLQKSKKTTRRIGRGGKRGSFSGKGIKGQKSRAGRHIRPQIRDILKKIHKRRGHGKSIHLNRGLMSAPLTISYRALEAQFSDGSHITRALLRKKRIIRGNAHIQIKILGGGKSIVKKFTFEDGIMFSKALSSKIVAQ